MSTPGKLKTKPVTDVLNQNRPGELKIKTKFGYLTLANNPQHPDFKIRILVKKIVGNAVQRNYYKRVLRKYLRDNRAKFNRYNDCIFYYHSKTRPHFLEIQNELNDKTSGLS